jgi:hypothetical protein
MTTTIDGSLGITFPSGSNPQAAPSKVLQVVQATYNCGGSYSSTASTSFVSTGFSASITPLFSTSKILIIVQLAVYQSSSSGFVTIYRNGSNIGPANGFIDCNAPNWLNSNACYLDSPATTSSTTYTLYQRSASGTNYVFGDSVLNTITLMEVAQ